MNLYRCMIFCAHLTKLTAMLAQNEIQVNLTNLPNIGLICIHVSEIFRRYGSIELFSSTRTRKEK